MDVFNNREWALLIWLFIILLYFLFSKKMSDSRKSFSSVISAFFVRQIQSILLLITIYMSVVIYTLWTFGLWNTSQIKNTLIWLLTVGFFTTFKINSIKEDPDFLKNLAIDNFKLIAIIQFIIGVYTFPLLVELIILPIITIITLMISFSGHDKKHVTVKKFLENTITMFGLLIIANTLYKLITNFSEITKEQTIYDFSIPPLLTLLYLPLIYFLMIYSSYENSFIRLNLFINNPMLRIKSKLYAIIIFNFRVKLLERWSTSLIYAETENALGIRDSIKHILKVNKAGNHPIEIPIEDGWSPYKAKDFLLKNKIKTGFYNRSYDNEWFAFSNMTEVGTGIIPDNIAYYISGTEHVAKKLKLKLNVNNYSNSDLSHKIFMEASEELCKIATGKCISSSIQQALNSRYSIEETYKGCTISTEINYWPDNKLQGYDLSFIITNISDED